MNKFQKSKTKNLPIVIQIAFNNIPSKAIKKGLKKIYAKMRIVHILKENNNTNYPPDMHPALHLNNNKK